ncbi:hypothetical protein H4I95_00143 [Botrytis cinerea]
MHYQFLPYFLLAFFTSLLPASASPLYYSPSPRDNNQIRSTRTTICLSDYFGGCCAIDEHGNYGSCMLSVAFLIYFSPSNLSSYTIPHSQYFFSVFFAARPRNLTRKSGTNATLLGSNVPWTGMPTTQTANEWACTNPVNGTVISAGCCTWSWSYVFSTNHLPKKIDTTYPNGVVLPTLQKSMACTASNAGLSKSKRLEDSDGVMKRGWGDVWSFW